MGNTNVARLGSILYTAYAILGLLLLVVTVGVALSGTSLFRHLNPVAGWFMVLLPSSPWLLLWLVSAAGGISRWGPVRLILAAASPVLAWQGISSVTQSADAWVPLLTDHIWQGAQGVLEIVLAASGVLGLVNWMLERRGQSRR